MSISTNPKPHPSKCGNCAKVGFDCDCDCHNEPIVAGFHEYIKSRELALPKISPEMAEALGMIYDTNPETNPYLRK